MKKINWDYSVLRPNMDFDGYKKAVKKKAEIRRKRKEKSALKKDKKNNVPYYKPIKAGSPAKEYAIFLKSKYWAYVRMKVMKRDKNTCVSCGKKTTLQVHHLTYKHHGIEHRFLKDLITVCDDCHQSIHEIQERNKMLGIK